MSATRSLSATTIRADHRRLYARIAIAAFLCSTAFALAKTILKHDAFNYMTGDGKSYYLYVASAVVDGDLDFRNQMIDHFGRELSDRELSARTDAGLVKDKYPIGISLTLAPAVLLAHAICVPLHQLIGGRFFAPDAYSPIYQLLSAAVIYVLFFVTLMLFDRMMVREVGLPSHAVAIAVALVAIVSSYGFHAFFQPSAVHTVSTFWTTATIALAMRLRARIRRDRLLPTRAAAALVFCFSMALVCRPTNIFILPFLIWLLGSVISSGLAMRVLKLLPILLISTVPVLVQLLVWRLMTGHWVRFSYAPEGFVWSDPKLWQSLLSTRCGLFVYSPMMLIAFVGFLWMLGRDARRRRLPLVICLCASFPILWYLNSAWWSWWFGESFGGRAYSEISLLFAIGLGWLIDNLGTFKGDAGRAVVAFMGGAVIYHVLLVAMWHAHWVPRADYLVPSWRINNPNDWRR